MFHTLAYNLAAAGVNAVNSDASMVGDTELRSSNSHLFLTTQLKLLGISLVGVSVIRGRLQIPRWNFYGEPTIFQVNRALTPPSNPQWDYWGEQGPMLPQNEEIQVQLSNNLGAATEQENAILQLGTPNWSKNLDGGMFSWWTRATFTVTPTINVWSGPQTITLAQSLLGGTYGVRHAIVQGANAVAWRFIFARNKLYNGYRLRPGGLIQTAIGDVISNQIDPAYGPWGMYGYFNTIELPQIEVLGATAAATTYQVFLNLVRISESTQAIEQYTSSSGMP